MNLLKAMTAHDYEQVIAFQNRATGLRGFLTLHDTTLGPALGGVRIRTYTSEQEALTDSLRLSRAMTYKAAISGLPCGGGKTVILLDADLKREAAFEALGRMIESLHGRYFCARDVGITDADLGAIARATRFVAREPSPELGDVSEHTARGVWQGMRACLERAGIKGPARVAIQGVGSVGRELARILRKQGMDLVVADVDAARAAEVAGETGARVVDAQEILYAPCDVLAPCALGGVINAESVPRLQCRIVCGSANNILATLEDGDALDRRGVLYGPDYLVNAGGLIRGAEFFLLGRADSSASIAALYERTRGVLELARERGISTARAADQVAEARLKKAKSFRDLTWEATGALSSPARV
ncbi:MAG TPA: Glu/Leu/Phe/Val dehydrogenase dimerization domain-containing protein [Candidatus Acidoferrum sp.]|nr:Glu/Leu/Phe/Val dehydrogenase dimerization domain-containing protein [Candidatus Acidoferrum sp.]